MTHISFPKSVFYDISNQAVDLTNSTLDTGNGDDEVEVFRRTTLWHNLVYKNMVRHLLPVLTSQV